MLYKAIDQLEDYCGEFADDFDLNETVESIDTDLLNEVLDKFEK